MNMIISPTDFLYNGDLFFRNPQTGRCYRLAEPSGYYSKAARKGLLASKRVSPAAYNESLAACKSNVMIDSTEWCGEQAGAKDEYKLHDRQPGPAGAGGTGTGN